MREKRSISSSQDVIGIYKDPKFMYFRSVFNSVLKDLHQEGVGTSKKQASVISVELEEKLWNDGILGDGTPQTLLDTLVFCLGMNLALRSGKEHQSLRPNMFELFEPPNAKAYLTYTESGSKNNTGGLRDRKVKNKCQDFCKCR